MSNPAFGKQVPGSLIMAQGGDRPELYAPSDRKALIDAALARDTDAESLHKAQREQSTERTLARRPELLSEINQLGSSILGVTLSVESAE